MIRSTLKDWVIQTVKIIPYGLGENILKRYQASNNKKEAKKIQRIIENKTIKKVVVVYDEIISPLTYGDFLCTVFLSRYFATKRIFVNLVIIDGEYRKDWNGLTRGQKKQRNDEYLEMANLLVNPHFFSSELMGWGQFRKNFNDVNKDSGYVVLSDKVMIRSPIYHSIFDIINYLLESASKDFLKEFLFSPKDFSESIASDVSMPYITWHCRKINPAIRPPKKTTHSRNTTDKEFTIVSKKLSVIYPSHTLMIVSDDFGCDYFKDIARKNNIKCIYSKDYSDTFLGDALLTLKSAYHFSLRGGGIDIFALFSEKPYEIYFNFSNQSIWENDKLLSWSNENQLSRDIKGSTNIYPPTGKIKLKL